MSSTISYSISTDFGGNINLNQLTDEINADGSITTKLSHINTHGDNVEIVFVSAPSAGEKTALDGVVSAHNAVFMPTSSTFDAIVDAEGRGQYVLPSTAFAAGHKSIFVRNGTYVETQDIVVPDSGQMVGESGPNVIIYFIGAYSVKSDGGGDVESGGTMAIAKDSTSVVGTGTTFTNLSAGKFILLGTNYYRIASITDDTNLTLERTYRGRTITNSNVLAHGMISGFRLHNFIITGSSSSGLFGRGLWHFVIDSVACVLNAQNFNFSYCGDGGLKHLICDSSFSTGFTIDNCTSMNLTTADVFNCMSNGIEIKGNSVSIILNACESSNNTGNGFQIKGTSTNVNLSDCVARHNNGYGMSVGASTETIMSNDMIAKANESGGIFMDGTLNEIEGGCVCHNGGTGLIMNASDSAVAGGFYIGNNGDGIRVVGNDNIVKGVRAKNNTSDGIHIAIGATDTISVYNNLKGNTGAGLTDNGTTSETTGNKS